MTIGTLLILEDVPEALTWLVEVARSAFPGVEIATARTVREAVAQVADRSWDMALIDLGLPDGSGLDVIRLIRKRSPATLCVVSTVLGDDAHIVAALSAGAHGYVLKGQPEPVLRHQLVQLQHGIPPLSPTIARRIMEHFQRTGPVAAAGDDLTPREQDVLTMVAKGLRNGEVASTLGLAESTIATHIKSIYRKLGISSRAEAALHATRLGLA